MVVIIAELFLDEFIHKTFGCHAALCTCLGAWVMAENNKALFSSAVKCHEHVYTSLLLHASQLSATVTSNPTFTIHRDMHLCAVVPVRDISDRHRTANLLQ